MVLVVACEQESCSKWPGSSSLGVVLFDIADIDDELFDWHVISELDPVVLNYFKKVPGRIISGC